MIFPIEHGNRVETYHEAFHNTCKATSKIVCTFEFRHIVQFSSSKYVLKCSFFLPSSHNNNATLTLINTSKNIEWKSWSPYLQIPKLNKFGFTILCEYLRIYMKKIIKLVLHTWSSYLQIKLPLKILPNIGC